MFKLANEDDSYHYIPQKGDLLQQLSMKTGESKLIGSRFIITKLVNGKPFGSYEDDLGKEVLWNITSYRKVGTTLDL